MKRSQGDADCDSDAWWRGSGSIVEENLELDVVQCAQSKPKRVKISSCNTSTSPIKTTQLESSSNQLKQSSHSPLLKSIGVTAVYAAIEAAPRRNNQPSNTSKYKSKYKKPKTSSKKAHKPKLIKVLLDSGSDGDLLFHKKGTPKYFPSSTRQVPKPWCTSNGTFHTEGKGSIAVKFFQYSNSKGLYIQPDIVEYDGDKL